MDRILQKNTFHEISIESLCGNGNGVGRIDGMVVFVKNAAVGDILLVKLIKVTKKYAVAKLEKIIKPSPDRFGDGCVYSKACGGCVFQHITYESELNFKINTVNDAYLHIGGIDLKADKIYGAENTCSYRNKAIYPVDKNKDGKLISGFFAPMSHRVVEHDLCLIGPEIFNDIKNFTLNFLSEHNVSAYNEETQKGIVRNIYLRKNSLEGLKCEISLTLVLNSDYLINNALEKELCNQITEKYPQIKTILININKKITNAVLSNEWRIIYGDGYITDILCDKTFRISPASFYQVNHAQAEKLYSLASQYLDLKDGECLLDLYCGTGTVGICLSKPKTKLYGVEIVPEAVEDAIKNAKINNVDAKFFCLDAENALSDKILSETCPDAIVIDPPRKGCTENSINKICSYNSKRIVYISCDVATQARDLKLFIQNGYTPVKGCAVDMFPRTGHVECVVLLCRNGDKY